MARSRSSSSSSSKWRYCNPSYYLKRPKRLALLLIVFVCASLFVWDRQTLVREHEVEISILSEELNHLKNMLEELNSGDGDAVKLVSDNKDFPDEPIDVERRQKVKEAMIHAWSSYEKYAWGHDELQPQSKKGVDSFGGIGATLIDALDTLFIMGLDEQFQRAREWVANSLDFNKDYSASMFETTIREMWEKSMKGLLSLVRKTTPSSFTYICEKHGGSLTDKMDELACFAPGMLALGSSGYGPADSQKILSLAEELAWTCYNFYQSTPTKLAGENYFFHPGEDMSVGTSWNILRPETVESLFYLWRFTGNRTYREWGWDIFQAFEKNSRIETGYVGLKDVNTGVKDDKMQSFFLAETLKYLYLLFSPSSVISLDEWVFNTEAHPLRIVTRHDEEHVGQSKNIQTGWTRGRKEGLFGDH